MVAPPVQMGTTQWAIERRRLSPKSTARPGRYNPDLTPWVWGMHKALDDAKIWKVVCRKSAQVAWTDGVLLNYIGRRIDIDPCPMIVMFPKEGDGKRFDREKFVPMVEVTPTLASKIPVHKVRDKDNAADHKGFPGGFLNFVGSNSPGSVKSTPAPVVAIEEPDDANSNVKDQGDTITLLEERTKTYHRRKVIFGGTPTIAGVSRIDAAYTGSDQRQWYVACPDCGELQTLSWAQVKWQERDDLAHEIYGKVDIESARYCCVGCGSLWTGSQKNAAVRKAGELEKQGVPGYGWVAGATFHGVAGFAINEIYSLFPGSAMPRLLEKYLTATHALAQGDDTKIRSFRNNTEGLPYSYKSTVPSSERLRERAEQYAELTVPWGGVVLTAGVDVQHDRLAVVIRAWGRGEESWLLFWGEIPGRTMVVMWDDEGNLDPTQSGAWADLDKLLTGGFVHASGATIKIRAASIDSSDGQTQDAVYNYVRRRMGRGFMAIKGASTDKVDIFSAPKHAVDPTGKHKPHPTGVRPYIVGTQVAKDLILGADEQAGRIKLLGNGPGRMHWYADVRSDYYDQITSEVKVPHRLQRHKLTWALQSGRRNEALDCEVYALHAARSLRLNLWRPPRWDDEEAAIKQPALWADAPALAVVPGQTSATAAPDNDSQQPAPAPAEANPQPAPTVRRTVKQQAATKPLTGGWRAKNW